jgi:hypothetical protein
VLRSTPTLFPDNDQPCAFLELEKDLGTSENCKIADLVLLDAAPLTDVHDTAQISEVLLSGKEFDRRALEQISKEAEAGAKSTFGQLTNPRRTAAPPTAPQASARNSANSRRIPSLKAS